MRRYHKVASKGKLYLTTRDSIEEAEYQEDESIRELFVEDGVQEVGENAFLKCKNLRTVFLPDSLQEINADVFGFCERSGWETGFSTSVPVPFSTAAS